MPTMAQLASFSDNFDAGISAGWALVQRTAASSGGRASMTVTSAGSADLRTPALDLTNKAVTVETVSVPTATTATTTQFLFEVRSGTNVVAEWLIYNNTLRVRTAGFTTVLNIPWDPVAHRFLSIRDNNGSAVMETAPSWDPDNPDAAVWTVRHTVTAHGYAITASPVWLQVYTTDATHSGAWVVDNFTTPGAASPPPPEPTTYHQWHRTGSALVDLEVQGTWSAGALRATTWERYSPAPPAAASLTTEAGLDLLTEAGTVITT